MVDGRTERVSFFSQSWGVEENVLAAPRAKNITHVVKHALNQAGKLILVHPIWPKQAWWATVEKFRTKFMNLSPAKPAWFWKNDSGLTPAKCHYRWCISIIDNTS